MANHTTKLSLRKFTGKKIVSFLRNGDFAHPGETEAIDIVMNKFDKNINREILDVGCGLGGTAEYMCKKNWGNITAFDIDKSAIEYAKSTYHCIDFYESDVINICNIVKKSFDVFCLFNSFYTFPDQYGALKSLRSVAKVNGVIAIFDYSTISEETEKAFKAITPVSEPFYTIKLSNIEDILESTRWHVLEVLDISDLYEKWYSSLVSKLILKKEELINNFGDQAYIITHATYSNMLSSIRNKILGGHIIYGQAF